MTPIHHLKRSYDVAKKNIIVCIWCNAMCLCGLRLKTHYFPHTVHYCCSSILRLSETCRFLQSSSFWEVRCVLIGQLSSALWLAEYLKHVMEALNCSCPNFFWNVLQVWMTGKDVYLQITWSWPDKTWNILCSYCLQWNTSQSKFRNHYFLFLFAFSILSQLFLIWGCTT